MKRVLKILTLLVVVIIALALFFNSQKISILGKVIEFSEDQESRGNVFSIMVISFLVIGIIVLFTFMNVINNYYDKQNEREEIDRMIGKKTTR